MKKTLFTAILTLTTFVLFSQSGSNFTVRLNTLIPSGEFKDDDYDDFLLDGAGGAGPGFGLGFEFAKEIEVEGLSIIGSVDVLVNGLSKEIKENIEDDLDPNDKITYLKYINAPVLIGAKYSLLASNIGIFGKFNVGLNMLHITNYEVEYDGYGTNTLSFDNSLKLAYGIGAGIVLNEKISIGFDYLGLGSHPIDGKDTYEDDSFDSEVDISDYYDTRDITVSGIKLHIGLIF